MPSRTSKRPSRRIRNTPPRGTNWGCCRQARERWTWPASYFDKASECDPKFVQPYLQISILELQASRWQSLADVTDKLVKLDPFDYPQAFYFNSVANYNLHNMEAAEKSALVAERLDTRHSIPKVSHLLGLILAYKKDYAGAAERFKAYLKFAPEATDAAKVRSQLAEVEKITAASGGAVGQTIVFCRLSRPDRPQKAMACPTFRGRRECRGWRSPSW
jgi:tetratricopeptide (TPR) repeat protein